MDTNRINEINASVHQSSDLDGALSVYNLLKSNGYDIKSNMGTLMDYCKTRGLDRVKSNVELLVKYDEELAKKESVMKSLLMLILNIILKLMQDIMIIVSLIMVRVFLL